MNDVEQILNEQPQCDVDGDAIEVAPVQGDEHENDDATMLMEGIDKRKRKEKVK